MSSEEQKEIRNRAAKADSPASLLENDRRSELRRWIKGAVYMMLALSLVAAGYLLRQPERAILRLPASAPPAETSRGSNVEAIATERKILYWQDPMHPQYRSEKPGKAPDCGMDLVPVYAGVEDTSQGAPAGAFKVSPEKQQLIGVQYGEVVSMPLVRTIRAVGRLAYNETRITRVHSKIAGWIERVYVDFTGELVAKNQPLLSLYSPDLVATQEEYLLALKARDRLGESSFKEVADGANLLLEAARRRLELWDISDAQIAEVEKAKKPVKALTLYSSANGFVISRNAYERQRIMPETELYAIADLSTVWVLADIYEFEVPLVRLGQAATMTLAYFPGRTFRGRVTYIYPQLDNATRTLKVRLEFPNPDFALKPDMYADVALRFDYGRQLSVSQEAVLDSGSEQIVFVALDGGYFEPRRVRLGGKVNDRYIILSDLKAGERVVTSGNFLIDSESRLKSSVGGMGMPGMQHVEPGKDRAPAQDHSMHQQMNQSQQQASPRVEKAMDRSKHQKNPEGHKHD